MAATADVVIIGGGVRGSVIAYYLAGAGVRVILVEKGGFASEASGSNIGLVNVSRKVPASYAAFSLESANRYPDLVAELGLDVGYERHGYLEPIEAEAELAAARAHLEAQNQVSGLKLELLTAREARALEPALTLHVAGALYCAQDGGVIPMLLVRALGRRARERRVDCWLGTEVTRILAAGGRVRGVETSRGRIEAPVVVSAAGIHTAAVGRMAGVEIPVAPERGQVFTTERLPRLLRRPVGSLRQYPAGNFLIGTTRESVGADKRVTVDQAADKLRRARRLIPALAGVEMIRFWAGLRPMPADGKPIYDEAEGPRGFYVATGHSGITLAPITGQLFTEWLTTGKRPALLEPYRLGRFQGAPPPPTPHY